MSRVLNENVSEFGALLCSQLLQGSRNKLLVYSYCYVVHEGLQGLRS